MNETMQRTMQESMRLMQAGDLAAATRAIQQGLNGEHAVDGAAPSPGAAPRAPIEGEFSIVADARAIEGPLPNAPDHGPGGDDGNDKADTTRDDTSGTFTAHHFAGDAGAIDYMLFLPPGPRMTPPPLLLMLHGCTQSPDDFARGTRMNRLALEQGYVVAYPAQSAKRNPNKCWNWFRPQDQRRGQGEPAVLAALAAHLVRKHALDASRVYAAGLSAGGAMAAVLASAYPDVIAAIGVHSGLPAGVARDLPSALAAMKQGRSANAASTASTVTVPAIVFHGDRDSTVHPRNGAAVTMQATGASASSDKRVTVERDVVAGGRRCTRSIHRDDHGRITAEEWVVHGAGHAWFGGDTAGTYADPAGPDASMLMLQFFRAQSLHTS